MIWRYITKSSRRIFYKFNWIIFVNELWGDMVGFDIKPLTIIKDILKLQIQNYFISLITITLYFGNLWYDYGLKGRRVQ